MALGMITIIHIVLAVLVIIELGITGYLVNMTSGFGASSPATYAFLLFDSIWSLFIVIYLAITPIYLARFYHALAAFVLLVITTIFWFAGAIALACFVGAPACHGNNWCQTNEAGVAFAFFLWAGFLALTILEGLTTLRGHARADKTTPSNV
ncbi:uncharacterized protein TrAFT101_005445 [Trichoderma asperellum]|uniref:MARVEL domain-containing protein n=1 Tax=Trichoderma asperellum (strain ATCC 204424 / CBS 433.97 / NBRC 101777) TaxID=1042311 RepID=A0A2T3YYP5_TRIA4|nr:hypothetical protein M441DRAFT_148335 [Trichoderma asperellum CBS 433.97]PTB37676.1 hypothetical protein M441DRAFT_148335 [Trichoderma asperellum CBS 433.97]UKZ90426.1 hypothetical protein TrAFT101_005445 [Trichoderma asperellum]